ncbi:hypothetical protein GMRT_12697 [Giardia muris]|uniref:Uncharacterized protein n=1 Tax=Giardia muris TaxID=5742 RepID=A0A4Z1SYC2_GIAMU|nr:hypothetical protein GMRT_12697 [Giardia muris]|eukprot:TNJ30490.1 hypothetical protein GMRT_12697 [Giardia muris]
MSAADRLRAVSEAILTHNEECLSMYMNHTLLDEPLQPEVPEPIPNPELKGNERIQLASSARSVLGKPAPRQPLPPYKPKAMLVSGTTRLKKPNFTELYRETDARIAPRLPPVAQKAGNPAPIGALTKQLAPPRHLPDKGGYTQEEYRDVTVRDINTYGLYEMKLRGEIPTDIDVGPVFFNHPADVFPTLNARPLETVREVRYAEGPHIRDDIPRVFGSLKLDFSYIEAELGLQSHRKALQTRQKEGSDSSTFVLERISQKRDNDSDIILSDDDRPLGLEQQRANRLKGTGMTPPKSQALSTTMNGRGLLKGLQNIYERVRDMYLDSSSRALVTGKLLPSQSIEDSTTIQLLYPGSIPQGSKFQYLLSNEFVYDYNIPIVQGRIVSNTSVYNAMMVQHAFVTSYISFIMEKLQQIFNRGPQFDGHVNGNEVINLALSSYFPPHVQLADLPEEDYMKLVLVDDETSHSMKLVTDMSELQDSSATKIQAFYRMHKAQRQFFFIRQSFNATICIQSMWRRLLAIRRRQTMAIETDKEQENRSTIRQRGLQTCTDRAIQQLHAFAETLPTPTGLDVKVLLIFEVGFWKTLLRAGYIPTEKIFILLIITHPSSPFDSRVRIGSGYNENEDMLPTEDIGSLILDPRVHLIILAAESDQSILNTKEHVRELYRDAIVGSKLDLDRITLIEDDYLKRALEKYSLLANGMDLLLRYQLGETRMVLKESVQQTLKNIGVTSTSILFILPLAHQQLTGDLDRIADLLEIPIYGRVKRDALRLSYQHRILSNDETFKTLSNASIDRSRSRGPNRVASFGISPIIELSSTDVTTPKAWNMQGVNAATGSKYPCVLLRPDIVCFIPGGDIVSDDVGGLYCGMIELDEGKYSTQSTNKELIELLRFEYPYKSISQEDLVKYYQRSGAVMQMLPSDENVLGYVSFVLQIAQDGTPFLLASFSEITSVSYFPVGKIMSAGYITPGTSEVEVFVTTAGIFARTIATELKYSGMMTLSFALTKGFKKGDEKTRICPRLLFNGASFGLTPRIFQTIYQRVRAIQKSYDYYVCLPSVRNKYINKANIMALVTAVIGLSETVTISVQTPYPSELSISVPGWVLEDAVNLCNQSLTIVQRSSRCESHIKDLLGESKDNAQVQALLEAIGTSPFYVASLNALIYGIPQRENAT